MRTRNEAAGSKLQGIGARADKNTPWLRVAFVLMVGAAVVLKGACIAAGHAGSLPDATGPSFRIQRGMEITLPAAANNPAGPWKWMQAQTDRDLQGARRKWEQLTPEQRERYRRWKQLSPEQRARLRKRYKRFRRLPPEQRERIRRNWDHFRNLSPAERRRIREQYESWRRLSPEQKQRAREHMRRFRKLSPEKKRRVLELRKKWNSLPAEQREHLRRQYRQRLEQRQQPNNRRRQP